MTIIRAIAFLLHFTLVPVACGRLITYRVKNPAHRNPIVTYVVGWFGSLGIYYLLCAGFTWHQNYTLLHEAVVGDFTRLKITYSVAAAIICLLWVLLDWQWIKEIPGRLKARVGSLAGQFKADHFTALYAAGFAVLLIAQLYFAYDYQVNEWSYDDYDYVVNSVDDIAYDMIANVSVVTGERPVTEPKRVATSWPAYIAYLSEVSGFQVTTVCHTILPVLLLLIAYGVFYYMACGIFDKLDNRLIFMIILSVAFIFGLHSHYALTFRLLCVLWQGKAVLSAIAVPFLMIYLPTIYKDEIDGANCLPVLAVSLGASSLTTMSLLLVSLITVLMWFTMSIYHRKPYGLRYLICGMLGPGFQMIFYTLITLLLDQQMHDGEIWFGWLL